MPTPDQQTQSMIANLEAKTGKTLPQWVAIARACGLDKHGKIVSHLKSEHGLTHGYANLVAHTLLRSDAGSSADDDLLAGQYAGAKTVLRPIYDAIVAACRGFGDDVELSPKKAYVSLRRSKQFALVQPSTKTRVDLGLNLKGVEPDGRLEASGSFNAMCSHRVRLADVSDVDAAVVGWLEQAYERA